MPHVARISTRLPVNSPWRSFATFFAVLLSAYGFWLAVFSPGILGQDSLAILLEIQNPDSFRSGKPAFWYYFVRLFFESTRLTEAPIGMVLVLSALVFARILSWCWVQQLRKTVWFSLAFVCLAPHTLYFLGTLYPDGIYSVAVAGLLFELWLGARERQLGRTSLIMIFLTLPFAAFARQNGIVFLLPAVIVVFLLQGTSRYWLGCIVLAWCALVATASHMHKTSGHGVLYPMAIHETVNFLQPRPMNLWTAQPRVLPHTLEILQRHQPLQVYLSHYDPDYWDPLQFMETGPRVLSFPSEDQTAIVRDFWRYNLWHNMPRFVSSRINLFLVASLAQGGLPDYYFSQQVLEQIPTQSVFRRFQLQGAETALMQLYEFSYTHRWLLWTPFLGMALLAWTFFTGMQRRDIALLIVSIPMVIQLGAIFVFSIAGEYRYLLGFFMITIVLLPVIATHRAALSARQARAPDLMLHR